MRYLWIVALVCSAGCTKAAPPPTQPDLSGSGVATLQGATVAAPATKEELLRMLRDLPPGELLLLGYAGADGDLHQLSEADLRCQQP